VPNILNESGIQGHNRIEKIYSKHHMLVEAAKTQSGWCWSYLIDGRVYCVNKMSLLPSAQDALRQGLVAARTRVDELTRAGWS